MRCGERQVADVEFEAFRVLPFFPAALLLVVVSIANADASTVDTMTVEGFDGGFGHGLLGVGHETKPAVDTSVVGQDNAVGHVAVGFEQVAEFVGADFARQTADEETGAGRRSLTATAATTAALALEAEVGALPTVFTDVGCDERGTTGRPLGKHGFGSGAPALARVVEGAGALVEFSPASAEVVGEGTVGLVAARRTLDVPIAVQLCVQVVTARGANGVEHAAVIPLSEVKANHGFDFLDHGSADVAPAHGVGGLVHEPVNQTGDKELAVEVLRLNGSGLAFDGENHGFTVLLVELHHFAQHRVANDRRHDGLGGGDGNGAVVNVDVADHGGDDVAVSKGGPFAVFVFAFFGDDASWGDEARRHVSHSCRRHGPRWVARRSLNGCERSLLLNPPYGLFIGFLRESCVPLSVKPPALDVRRSGSFCMVLVDGWKAEFGSQHGFGFPSV